MSKFTPILITALIAFAVIVLTFRVGFLNRLATGGRG